MHWAQHARFHTLQEPGRLCGGIHCVHKLNTVEWRGSYLDVLGFLVKGSYESWHHKYITHLWITADASATFLRGKLRKMYFLSLKAYRKLNYVVFLKKPLKPALMEQKKHIYFLKTIKHKIVIIIQRSHLNIRSLKNTDGSVFLPPSKPYQPSSQSVLCPMAKWRPNMQITHNSNQHNHRHG